MIEKLWQRFVDGLPNIPSDQLIILIPVMIVMVFVGGVIAKTCQDAGKGPYE